MLHLDLTEQDYENLKKHTEKWIEHTRSTERCDRDRVISGIRGLYESAGLSEPKVVIVDSPLQMALVYGTAALWWYRQGQESSKSMPRPSTRDAVHDTTLEAVHDATLRAVNDATGEAVHNATHEAVHNATLEAVYAATHRAVDEATLRAVSDATHEAVGDATREAVYAEMSKAKEVKWSKDTLSQVLCGVALFCCRTGISIKNAVGCATKWGRVYQGGRTWGGWITFITAFREMGWLDLPEYEKWRHYEDAAEGGFQCFHEKFCVVSENPEVVFTDRQNRAHCEEGPSHRWRDGWSLYHWHGVRVKEHVIMEPHLITLEEIGGEVNAEVRRVLIERYGIERYLGDTDTKLVDSDMYHGLPRILVQDMHADQYLYGSDNSTGRVYAMPVDANATTCREAHESICGFDETTIAHQS